MSDELPQGWAEAALEDVGEIVTGNTPPKNNPANYGNKYPWAKPPDLDSGVPITKTAEFLSETGAQLARLLPEGATLVSCIGLLGKVGYAGTTLTTNQQINSVVFEKRLVEPRYGFHYCKTLRLWLEDNSSSTTVAIVNKGRFSQAPIRLAPLPEQRRIVVKLEKLLGQVDACQQRLAKIPTLLKRFRQSVLAAACSGRLTADWREENPNTGNAGDLISQVSQRRREKLEKLRATPAKNRHASLNDFDNVEPALRSDLDLTEIPNTWAWVDLRFMMTPEEPFCYGVVQPGEDDPQGPRLIRVCDMENGQVLKKNLRGIPPSIHAQYQRSVLRGGEVLVSVVGTIGRPAIAPLDWTGVNIARAVAKIPVREFEAWFVLLWLSTSRAESWMVGDAREVARKTLNLEQLRTLPIPLPPLPEQQEVVRRVKSLFVLADQLEARLAAAQRQVNTLTPSLLARAFAGKLVPQDPKDEPASALLERMRSRSPDQKGRSK